MQPQRQINGVWARLLPALPYALGRESPPDLATLCAQCIGRDAVSSLQVLIRGHGWRLLTPTIRAQLLSALGAQGALSDGLLEHLLHSGVQDLDLSECAQVTNRGMVLVTERCAGLARLRLQGLSLSDGAISPLALRCTHLAALDVSRCRRISDGCVAVLAQHLDLIEIDLSHCRQLGDGAVESVLRLCPRILQLMLDGTRVSDALLGDGGDIDDILQRFPGLRCLTALSLQGCRLLSTNALGRICRHTQALQWLRLGGTAATDDTIEVIAESIPGLHALSVEGCSAISGSALPLLLLGCSTLAALDVGRCSLVSSIQFHHSSHSLCELQLSHCASLSAAALMTIAENCEALCALWLEGCAVLDDSLVFELCQGCSALARVSFSYCDLITERAVFYVAMQLRHITQLCLCGCAQLHDDQVLATVKMCTALRFISLPSGSSILLNGPAYSTEDDDHRARMWEKA